MIGLNLHTIYVLSFRLYWITLSADYYAEQLS